RLMGTSAEGTGRNHTEANPCSEMRTVSEFIKCQKARLPGRRFRAKDIGRRGFQIWRCEAVTLRPQTNYTTKAFVLLRQRLGEVHGEQLRPGEGAQKDDIEYRLGYYTVARNGRWWWGQYALMIPATDLGPLLHQAREEGTLRASDLFIS